MPKLKFLWPEMEGRKDTVLLGEPSLDLLPEPNQRLLWFGLN